MDSVLSLSQLPELLLPWYEVNKRELPWRQDCLPYHVWVSEIMLQQTRVEAVKGYYTRFLSELPDIQSLAQCDDDTLNKLWEGLGYYSRVRNLKKAAVVLTEQYGGQFPRDFQTVLALPGIGEYTAGAICSIAFDMPTPAVDGNVLRVLARLRNDRSPIDSPKVKEQVRLLLSQIYPEQAGAFTQALMELGATICGPNRAPRCELCPCRQICLAYAQGTAQLLPVKSPKKERRAEELTVLILSCGDSYALERRPDTGLLASLYQFPNLPGILELNQVIQYLEAKGMFVRAPLRQVRRNHIFTHIRWDMQGFYLEVSRQSPDYIWMSSEQIRTLAALPTAFRQFWEEIEHV